MSYHIAELTVEEINLIGHALGKLPYEAVHALLSKVKGQIEAHELAQKAVAIASVAAPQETPSPTAPATPSPA